MDAQGQAPVVTAALPVNTLSTPLSISSAIPAPIQVPLAGLEASTTPSLSTSPAALPPLTDLAKNGDRPDGPAALENAADSKNVNDESEQAANISNTLTTGSAIPPATQSSLQPAPPATLNADAVNAAGEAEHAARVEQEAKVESALLAADQVKHEQDDSNLQRQRTPLTDLSLAQTNATLSINTAEQTPRSPPSPSSTSALSSVTVSAAPSVIAANHNPKDTKEDEEESSEPAVESDRKPRSTGGRSTARRAASNASLKETAAASSSSSTRRPDKPPSTSTSTNGGRTRGASAQAQPQRQSSRSKATTAATSGSTSSNTRPRIRQRGSPDPKDGNDTTPGTRRSRRTRQSTTQNGRAAGEEEDESDDGDEGVTRCVCGNNDDETSAFMIQCETCKAWQHGPCVGFKHENDTPDTYYCEQCRPELHPSMTSNFGEPKLMDDREFPPRHSLSVSFNCIALLQQCRLRSRGKKHARSVSASSKPTTNGGIKDEKDESLRRSTSRDHQAHRDLSASGPLPTTAATSSGHPSYHRARSSADAAIITSFLDTSQGLTPPPPASPGSPGSNQGSSDGGTKRPMYPSTSHFAAPQNPKRRSTMNSRDSAAFDESILLATQRAFRESRAMAMEGGKGSSKARKRKHREDDDMEPVKEEEEDHSDRELSSSAQPEGTSQRRGAPPPADDTLDKSNIDPSLEEHHDEEGEGEDDGDEHDDMSLDANGASAPRKRRRRRGAGALFTAPNKKRAATSRSKKGAADEADSERNEELTVKPVQLDDTTSATEDEAKARKRKRDDANQDDGRPARAASPTASHDTSVGSHSSSDKPLAQANKRRKASPSEPQGEAGASTAPPPPSVTNILGSTLQVAIPTFTEDSAAPSPAASLPPGQGDVDESGKEQEHAEAITNGLLAVSSSKGKKAVDTDREESTPAPAAQGDESAAAVANGKGIKQPNQYTYKRGGPGSRGGMKGSPSKRAALAAAAEARHGKHRDDTPSTYEDWINQPPSWGIPDHLSHLSHLLPSQSPLPLQVTKFISSPNNSAAPSPITPQGESGTVEQAVESAPSTPAITISSSLEPSAKIRFPSRRMSIAEMRKRAKSMLDYLARVQVDTVDRSNRNRALAAVQETILESELKERNLTPPPSMRFNKDSPLTPQATSLIDDLSRQLNSFQEKFL